MPMMPSPSLSTFLASKVLSVVLAIVLQIAEASRQAVLQLMVLEKEIREAEM